MQVSGACDCVVIVTRWYGGELLGPIRFQHIEAVALSALHAGGFINAPPGLKTPSNAPPNPLFSNDPPTIQPAPEPSQSAPPTAAEVQSQAQRDKLIRLCRARDGTIDSLNHNIQKLHLRLFENQRTIRTLKGTRTDDMSHLNAPEAPSPIKGPPPASEYAAMTDVEVEAKLKERDARIVALKGETDRVEGEGGGTGEKD
ncbi:hypothetical protein BC829DRAFT_494027 [Chytridium lagenaria]|nr:hypothetical protein BC829DRAFT_494027 [Chytridium lagenaria]